MTVEMIDYGTIDMSEFDLDKEPPCEAPVCQSKGEAPAKYVVHVQYICKCVDGIFLMCQPCIDSFKTVGNSVFACQDCGSIIGTSGDILKSVTPL